MRHILGRVFLIACAGTLATNAALVSAQSQRPSAPQRRTEKPADLQIVTPQTPRVSAGRTDRPADSQNMYVSTSLPTTGHATFFRRYAATTQNTPTIQRRSPTVSPYLNLTLPGNSARNYYLGVQRDQQIFDTGTQIQQLNTQVGGSRREFGRPQGAAAPPVTRPDELTPLQRRTREATGESGDQELLIEQMRQLRTAQNESSRQEQAALEALLNELKAIRESLSPKKDAPEPEKGSN